EEPQRRQHDQRGPADRLDDVPAAHVPELVRDHDVLLRAREALVEDGVHTTTCVDGPKPTVNAFAWSVHDDTSSTRTGVPCTCSIRSSRTTSALRAGSSSGCD